MSGGGGGWIRPLGRTGRAGDVFPSGDSKGRAGDVFPSGDSNQINEIGRGAFNGLGSSKHERLQIRQWPSD